MTDIKDFAERIAKQHNSRNPFKIAESLGFAIVYVPLIGVRGFYQQLKRNKFIYISDQLDEQQSRLVCAHELGHWFFHRSLNRVFLDTKTLFVSDRYETEANRFAVCLLYSDEEILEYNDCSIDILAKALGISRELAEYRTSL